MKNEPKPGTRVVIRYGRNGPSTAAPSAGVYRLGRTGTVNRVERIFSELVAHVVWDDGGTCLATSDTCYITRLEPLDPAAVVNLRLCRGAAGL